jgi:hypothetical protein
MNISSFWNWLEDTLGDSVKSFRGRFLMFMEEIPNCEFCLGH